MSLLVIALVIVGLLVGLAALSGAVILVLKIAAIIGEAGKPAHQDQGNYSLEQGREIRPEEERA